MNRRSAEAWHQGLITALLDDLIFSIDHTLVYVYKYIELPIRHIFCCCGNISSYYYRRPSWFDFSKSLTQILVHGYAITFFLYFISLLFAQLFSIAIQKYYFIDPFLSYNRQCINIQFVRITHDEHIYNNTRLRENFIRENFIIGEETDQNYKHNYTQLDELLDLLDDNHYVICQRSLYLYARFQTYSSLLHSNHSQFRFFISKYSSSFTIDQPPFLDLCVHTSNRSHLEQVQSRLLPLASYYYTSVNLFIFNFNFTQVSITLYQLNNNSTHLERISIHTGWLRDIYSQFNWFKYDHALSTVLFDGLSRGQSFITYFDDIQIPVPADPLLGLNEMVQESIMVLPLCQLIRNK